MFNKKIKNLKELWYSVKKSNKNYIYQIEKTGGFNYYFRALTAQILWFILFYSLIIKFMPIKDFLMSNFYIIIIYILISFLWKFIKNKLPSWIDYLTKGEFFYDLDIGFLNICIVFLISINFFIVILPIELWKKLYNKIIKQVCNYEQ